MSKSQITSAIYTGEAGANYHASRHTASPQTNAIVSSARAQKIQPYVLPNDRVLEFGVGSGWNLAKLRCGEKLGYDVAESVEKLVTAQGIRFVNDVGQIPTQAFDVVICHHVLEHVPDPFAVLQQLKTFLRPQGKLLLFVPYERERRYRNYERNEPNHHLFSWNVQTLANLVEQIGLRVDVAQLGRLGYDRFVGKLTEKLRGGDRTFNALINLARLIRPVYEVRIVAVNAQRV